LEAFGVLIKFKMALPWKPRYQNNEVGVVSAIALQWQFVIILIIPLSASILSVPFLGDAFIKFYATL
jgi:hypothetical protein